MDQQDLIAAATVRLGSDTRIRALFLAGSFGNGTADAWSDVDLVAVAEPADHEAIAADWRGHLESIAPVAHYQRLPFALVLHAVLAVWSRIDLSFAAPDALTGRAQDKLKPLIDRDGLYAALPATLPDPGPDKRRVASTISEFIRVLGLSHVADGRREYELAVLGYSMLRRMLSDILVAEMGVGDTGGILHLSKLIDASRMAILTSLPSPTATRDSVLTANNAVARIFIPRAKALAAKLGLDWPQSFEDATRAVLTRTMPEPYRPDW
jgi:hypothetical protein